MRSGVVATRPPRCQRLPLDCSSSGRHKPSRNALDLSRDVDCSVLHKRRTFLEHRRAAALTTRRGPRLRGACRAPGTRVDPHAASRVAGLRRLGRVGMAIACVVDRSRSDPEGPAQRDPLRRPRFLDVLCGGPGARVGARRRSCRRCERGAPVPGSPARLRAGRPALRREMAWRTGVSFRGLADAPAVRAGGRLVRTPRGLAARAAGRRSHRAAISCRRLFHFQPGSVARRRRTGAAPRRAPSRSRQNIIRRAHPYRRRGRRHGNGRCGGDGVCRSVGARGVLRRLDRTCRRPEAQALARDCGAHKRTAHHRLRLRARHAGAAAEPGTERSAPLARPQPFPRCSPAARAAGAAFPCFHAGSNVTRGLAPGPFNGRLRGRVRRRSGCRDGWNGGSQHDRHAVGPAHCARVLGSPRNAFRMGIGSAPRESGGEEPSDDAERR
jgi:hypothetical protein